MVNEYNSKMMQLCLSHAGTPQTLHYDAALLEQPQDIFQIVIYKKLISDFFHHISTIALNIFSDSNKLYLQ